MFHTTLSMLLFSLACDPDSTMKDADNDGILEDDCNDNDATSTNIKEDADCDGIPTQTVR